MNADSPRDPRPAQMSCGDPPRIPPPSWYSRACDQSEPMDSPPVQPSIREGHLKPEPNAFQKMTAAVERSDYQSRQLDAATAVIHQLMKRLGVTSINLPAATTELGPRASLKRGDQFYHVNAGTERGGS